MYKSQLLLKFEIRKAIPFIIAPKIKILRNKLNKIHITFIYGKL